MQDTTQPKPTAHGPQMTRRGLLKTVGAVGTAAAAPAALQGTGADPVGEADALACGGICIGAVAVGGAAALGWALREFEVLGSDSPATGLTADALRQDVFDTAQARQSYAQSTFVDNRNIIDAAKHVAYSDGKMAAIKALNNGDAQANVTTAGQNAVDAYASTIKSNYLKSWREAVNEIESHTTALQNHADVSDPSTALRGVGGSGPDSGWWSQKVTLEFGSRSITLPDGTTFDLPTLTYSKTDGSGTWDPLTTSVTGFSASDFAVQAVDPSGGSPVEYMLYSTWNDLWTQMETVFDEVRNGIATWVEGVYSQVQAGELDTAQLLTPRELAELTSSEETQMNQAIADLMSLNIPVNLDREAEITLTESGTTLYGSLGVTGEQTLNAGTTIDPSTDSYDYYFSYDVSQAHGTWDAYQEGVDGGMVTFTSEPHQSVTYAIETGAQETATVASADLTDNGDGTWSVDISSQVETVITTVTSVQFYSESDETQMETVLLDEPFKIVTFRNANDEEVSSADYTAPSEPETDNNYITQEEWEQREQAYKDLIDKYEQQANSSGGGGGGMSFGDFGPEGMVGGAVALVLTIVGIGQATK